VLVYILEAHASDTWPMKWSVEWPRPADLQQRTEYAKICANDLHLDDDFNILIDPMSNDFNTAFKPWPTACYLLKGRNLSYIGTPEETDYKYDINLLFERLEALL